MNFKHRKTRGIPTSRSEVAQTTVVYLLTLAALALLAATLAYWTRVWLIAQPGPAHPTETVVTGNVASVGELFGVAQPRAPVAVAAGPEIALLGVMAAASRSGRGYAIVQLDGKDIFAVRESENIAPGIRLAEVEPDHIVLEHNETRERLALPEKNRATEASMSRENDSSSFQDVLPHIYE